MSTTPKTPAKAKAPAKKKEPIQLASRAIDPIAAYEKGYRAGFRDGRAIEKEIKK